MTAIPAIVLHCSKAGLAVIRALGARGIPIVGAGFGQGQMGLSSRFVRTALRAPHPAEDEPAFIEFLQELAPTWGGAVLFPSDDSSLVAVARNKDRLAKYFHVAAADWPVVQSLIEKARTYEIAARAGIPCPRLRIVDSLSCGVEFAKEIGFPCLIKPSVSHTFFRKFYQKMIFAHSRAELERGIETTLGYGGELMLCEFIPGNDSCGANYNSFCTNGNPLAEFTAQKLRLKPTLIGFPTAVQSKRLPDVMRVGRQMMKALMFSGFSCTEFKRDARDGIYKLMEVNARHNYSGQLATSCGINFPYLSYLFALGRPLGAESYEQKEGVHWIDEERDLREALKAALRGLSMARAYLGPYMRRKVFAVSSLSDPLPAAGLLGELLRR